MRASPRPRRRRPVLVVAGLLSTLGLVAVLLVLALRVAYAGEALPGTRVAGVALGGASRAEARRRLATVVGPDAPVVLHAAGRTYKLKPSVLGSTVDLDGTVSDALRSGRDGLLGGAASTVSGVVATRDVPVRTRVDRPKFRRTIALLADEIERPGFPGALDITTDPIVVEAVPPRTGRTVDRAELARRLGDAVRTRSRASVRLRVRSTRVASRDAVEGVARRAKAYLAAPLRLTGAGPPLEVSPAQLAGVLALESVPGGHGVRLGAGDARLTALVSTIASARSRPARNAVISAADPGVVLDAKGDTSWQPRKASVTVREGRPGRVVRRSDAVRAIEAAIREGRHTAVLPVRRITPAVSRTAARRIDSLIGTFTTHYVPGQPRVTNIRRIARAVDGTVIAPGAQFSLNRVAGERTTSKGYVEAPFIGEGNKLEPSVGGGVSQASTTIYNAAYFAGLQIDAHTPHSVFIPRYPAGRESTLNFGSIDLRWTNDTSAPILVQARTTTDSITVRLFGSNGGRRVRAVSAPRRPVPGGDFSVVVTRVVRYADGRVKREPFTTTYGIEKPAGE